MEKEDSRYCGCLYYSANALARAMTRMAEAAFAPTGLAPSYAFLLMTANWKPGIQPKDISHQMQLTPSTVTRLIEKLEVKGLLKRQSEGKNTLVFPTPAGVELHPKVEACWQQLYHNYVEILGEDVSQQLTTDIYAAVKMLDE